MVSLGIFNDDEHHHVDDGEDSQNGSVLEEVNTLGVAEREDEEDRGGGHYEVPVEEPLVRVLHLTTAEKYLLLRN